MGVSLTKIKSDKLKYSLITINNLFGEVRYVKPQNSSLYEFVELGAISSSIDNLVPILTIAIMKQISTGSQDITFKGLFAVVDEKEFENTFIAWRVIPEIQMSDKSNDYSIYCRFCIGRLNGN